MKFGFDLDEVVCDLTSSLLDMMEDAFDVEHFATHESLPAKQFGHRGDRPVCADLVRRSVGC